MLDDPRKESDLERSFDTQWRRLAPDLPEPKKHYPFHPGRKWEFDRAFIDQRVAIELEGIFRKGSVICQNCGSVVLSRKADGSHGKPIPNLGFHQHYGRFLADVEKYNAAAAKGWVVMRFTHDDVHGDPFKMCDTIRKVLDARRSMVPQVYALSHRENEILHFMAGGWTTPEIARRLEITSITVRSHASHLRQKLIAPNRAAAIARAFSWGLIDPGKIPWRDESVHIPTEAELEDDD